jgi:hypothetical protein
MSRLTNFPNGISSFLVDSNASAKTANYTVIITTDSGKTFTSEHAGMVYTLPAIAVGNTFTFVNNAVDGAVTLAISPNASDGITYAGTAVINKDLINTKVTSKRGDSVTLASLAGTTAWQVTSARGVWAKET